MDRETRLVKDENNNEVEVYVDICSDCSKEMFIPKQHADKMEEMFPFLKEKVKNGSPCMDCVKKKLEEDPQYNPFTQEEMDQIKNKLALR